MVEHNGARDIACDEIFILLQHVILYQVVQDGFLGKYSHNI